MVVLTLLLILCLFLQAVTCKVSSFATIVALEWGGWLLSILLLNARNKGLLATWLTLLLALDRVYSHRPCTLRLLALLLVLLVTPLTVTSFHKVFCILDALGKQYGIRQYTNVSVH